MSLGPSTQSDQELYHSSQRMVSPLPYQVGGGYMYSTLISPTVGITVPQSLEYNRPVHGVELQPSEACPKNFVIFDQTDERNRVMFHPALTQKFNCPSVDIHAMVFQDNAGEKNNDAEDTESTSSMKEDTEDIDALLSLEEEYDDVDEEVSTARTLGSFGSCCSPDSCSSYGSKPQKIKLSSAQKSSSGCNSFRSSGSSNEHKRQRMKKMVKVLRGIVPGADEMNTAAVLDEAVRYLKSLKVEVKKHGIGNFND